MYSSSGGAYESPGREGRPQGRPGPMYAQGDDLAAGLQLGAGTPRGNNGPGPSSARSYVSGRKQATPRGAASARAPGSTAAFGAVRLPRPPLQPKAPTAPREGDAMYMPRFVPGSGRERQPSPPESDVESPDGSGEEEVVDLPADEITPAMLGHTAAEPTFAEQLRAEHRRTQQELMSLMEQMVTEEEGESEQFHYLKRIPIDDYPANPYHLQIVPHSDISEEYFFTISSSGVTLYDNGTAEFTALDQWQREYYLFNEILQIRTFKIYRIWKAFMVWMKFVKKEKFSSATKKLTSGLFQLDPVLSSSLRTVRNLSCTLLDGALPTHNQHSPWLAVRRPVPGVWCWLCSGVTWGCPLNAVMIS